MMNIDQEIDRKKLAMSGMPPDQVQRRLRGAGGLLDALAAQKLLSEKEAYKRDFAMQMEQRPQTIAEKNEERLKQLSQTDVAQGVAGVLQNRKKRQDANTKMLAGMDPRKLKAMTKRPMGILNAPVPRVQKAAQGGIVGFQAGNEVMGLSGMDRTGFSDPTIRMLDNPLSEAPKMTRPGELIVEAGSTPIYMLTYSLFPFSTSILHESAPSS